MAKNETKSDLPESVLPEYSELPLGMYIKPDFDQKEVIRDENGHLFHFNVLWK